MPRQLLAVGPFPWKEIGLSPIEWRDCVVHESWGEADAMRQLRRRAFDVLVTSPTGTTERDFELVRDARDLQPGIRTVVLAPEVTPTDIITAMRNDVFACFSMPAPPVELRDAIAQALDAEGWKNGIEVMTALPHWISLRVTCRRTTADRLTRFVAELASGVKGLDSYSLATAFREVLLNAMEHGAGFDPDKVIEVAAIRTERAIVYYFKDPGPGFNPKAPDGVATEADPLSHLDLREAEGKRAGGFGMLLVSKLVDEVHYNEHGNEVFLVKHLDNLPGFSEDATRTAARA